jgi:hypothetical protein
MMFGRCRTSRQGRTKLKAAPSKQLRGRSCATHISGTSGGATRFDASLTTLKKRQLAVL